MIEIEEVKNDLLNSKDYTDENSGLKPSETLKAEQYILNHNEQLEIAYGNFNIKLGKLRLLIKYYLNLIENCLISKALFNINSNSQNLYENNVHL